MTSKLLLLLLLLLGGCAPAPEPSPSPSPEKSLLQRADQMLSAQDYEGAAVAYRELLDELEKSDAEPALQQSVQAKCTEALIEAGGFSDSLRVWQEMARKNPEAQEEAERMQARARRMMAQQAEELSVLASEDLAEGHKSKALATARAAEQLFLSAGVDNTLLEKISELLQKIEPAK